MPDIHASPILTKHASRRMQEMNVPYNTVVHVLRDPERDYVAPPQHTGRIACGDGIAVCYKPSEKDPTRLVVMTVLWDKPGVGFVRPEEGS